MFPAGLQANNDEKEAQIAKAEKDCQAYQQMLKEKDANIGELEKKVRETSRLPCDSDATGSQNKEEPCVALQLVDSYFLSLGDRTHTQSHIHI